MIGKLLSMSVAVVTVIAVGSLAHELIALLPIVAVLAVILVAARAVWHRV